MQNILAPQSEGTAMRIKYSSYGILESNFVFRIPLYSDMPNACPNPYVEEGEYFRTTANVNLRSLPNGITIKTINSGTVVARLEVATTIIGEHYWDKVSTSQGIGYIARDFLDPAIKAIIIDTSSNNNYSIPDINNIIKTEPNTTASRIKETYTSATIVDKNETEIVDNTLVGTGAKVRIDGADTYTIVKLGDVSGDGVVDARDSLRILKYSVGTYIIENEVIQASDINEDGAIDARDSLRILKYSVGTFNINI